MGKTAEANLAARAAALTFVVVVATAGTAFAAADAAKPSASVGSPSQPVATFTGEYLQGAPVYRLPPVMVSTSRAAALAAIAQEDMAEAARAGQVGGHAFEAAAMPASVAAAVPAAAAPDRNIALDVAVAAIATLAALALSFAVLAGRRRRRQVVLPQPRQWVAAQPYVAATAVPATAVPATAAKPRPLAPSVPRDAVSLTELRAQELRACRREAARRRADTTQPDAA